MKLTAEQYFKWKNSINEMWLNESRQKEKQCRLSMMEKDIEISKLKTLIYTEHIKDMSKIDEAKNQYQQIKKELEESLGTSLENSVINEVTFEVTKIGEYNGSD